jgi:hypothetical protein
MRDVPHLWSGFYLLLQIQPLAPRGPMRPSALESGFNEYPLGKGQRETLDSPRKRKDRPVDR